MGKAERHARDWNPTRFEPLDKARELYRHSVKIMRNPKVFKPENDLDGATLSDVRKTMMDIYQNAWQANRINVTDAPERAHERLLFQKRAIEGCSLALCLLELVKPQFHLPQKKFWNWVRMTINVETKLKTWHSAEVKKFATKGERKPRPKTMEVG